MKNKKKIIAAIITAAAVCAVAAIILAAVVLPRFSHNLKNAKIGGTAFFGSYEQNNDKSDGAEKIEWIVLAKENGKALITSRYALNCKVFNEENSDNIWETSFLREWLNSEFYQNAFSEDERTIIEPYSTDSEPGDNVFVLSTEEAEKYLSEENISKCSPTPFAKAFGARTRTKCRTENGELTCCYWLRSKGWHNDFAAMIYYDGSVYMRGECVDEELAVRPAIWVNIG